jgi:hypothetical protein
MKQVWIMELKNRPHSRILMLILFSLLVPFFQGSGWSTVGRVCAVETNDGGDVEDILRNTPGTMPKDYSDQEIDRMLEDIQQVDDASDVEGIEDSKQPDLSDEDRALGEAIKSDPGRYDDELKSLVWLNAHPWVVWYICYDYAWLDAHPHYAARIYLNYDFWYRYPQIAYIIALNRPFLIRYPRITTMVYQHDEWFIRHPYVAREVYRNYLFFNRYPDLYQRYYRHQEWIHRHPGIVRIAYGNRSLYKKHPEYLGHVYQYRRYALQHRMINDRHVKKMHGEMRREAERRSHDTGRDKDRGKQHGDQRDRGASEKLIRQGEQYNPDREYRHGQVPAPDKSQFRGKEGGHAAGPGDRGKPQGNTRGDRGHGGEKRK